MSEIRINQNSDTVGNTVEIPICWKSVNSEKEEVEFPAGATLWQGEFT